MLALALAAELRAAELLAAALLAAALLAALAAALAAARRWWRWRWWRRRCCSGWPVHSLLKRSCSSGTFALSCWPPTLSPVSSSPII
ncbi:hypothetical protein [Actinokineospora fastidiosa]|uniref:hypothetical protein n=1 Tax=Actinokineospora fastidiosa TaxID=1816 RepID=UPI00166F70C7|nr:hypothetical protein [Actinokineospora fastidiosa]